MGAELTDTTAATALSPLIRAKASVSKAIKRLDKSHQNTHGNYMFTSVDDFKDAIRPLMAAAGLTLHCTEKSFDLSVIVSGKDKKETNIARITYEFMLEHESGEISKPTNFTVCLPYTGAQTSGAAQSYAIKECVYKGMFQASSGDQIEDADMLEQVASSERLPKSEARPLYESLQKEITDTAAETRSSDSLHHWWLESQSQIRILPLDWEAYIKRQYAAEWKLLKAAEDMDRNGGQQ